MSDQVRNKQVLYPVTKELLDRLNIIDIFDLDFPRGSKFGAEGFIDYGGTEDYNKYLAYELDSDYGVESGEFGSNDFHHLIIKDKGTILNNDNYLHELWVGYCEEENKK